MPIGHHKRSWEKLAVTILIGGILATFVYALVLIVQKPERPKVVQQKKPVPAVTSSVTRAGSHYRQYRKSLALHEMGEWRQAPPESKQASDYNVLNPQMRRESEPIESVSALAPAIPVMPNSPVRRNNEKEDEDEDSTGWGWLADDVEFNRRAKEERTGNEDAESQDQAADDEQAWRREKTETRDDNKYFMESSYLVDHQESERDSKGLTDGTARDSFSRQNRDEFRYDHEPDRTRDQAAYDDERASQFAPRASDYDAPSAQRQIQSDYGSGYDFPVPNPFAAAQEASDDPSTRLSTLESRNQNESMFDTANSYESSVFGGKRSENVFATDSLFSREDMFSGGGDAGSSALAPLTAPSSPAGALDTSSDASSSFKAPSALKW